MPLYRIYQIFSLFLCAMIYGLTVKSLAWCWLILPIYIGTFLIILALHFIVAYFWSLFLKGDAIPEKPRRLYIYMTVETINIVNRLAGISIKGFDPAALPKGPCLVISNHISNFDPMVTAAYLRKKPTCFISKAGNFRVPIAGPFINKAGYICIDRENPRKAMEAIHRAVDRLKNGMWVGVYPEGTRSKTGELLPFSEGIFMIAKKAEVPIVVLTVSGTEQVKKRFLRKRSRISLGFAGIIDTETVADLRTGELSRIARNMMLKTLN